MHAYIDRSRDRGQVRASRSREFGAQAVLGEEAIAQCCDLSATAVGGEVEILDELVCDLAAVGGAQGRRRFDLWVLVRHM